MRPFELGSPNRPPKPEDRGTEFKFNGWTLPLTHRKDWETAMSLATFARMGMLNLNSNCRFLGVGAGWEPLIYWLAARAALVVPTDLYKTPGSWERFTSDMLNCPENHLPPEIAADQSFALDLDRILPIHMDARELHFGDHRFDGVFSSSSIEHVGPLPEIYAAFREMVRVTRKGGVICLATELYLSGTRYLPGDTYLFTPDALLEMVAQCPEVEFIGGETHFDDTAALREENLVWPLEQVLSGIGPGRGEYLLSYSDTVFSTVHMALRKVR